jgi:hemerythrin-like domain-containing protein
MPAKRTKSTVDQQIDENLKRVYDDMLKEDVPDRFMDLIQQLRQSDGSRSPGGPDGNDSDDA